MNYKVEGLNDLSKQFHEFQVNAGFTDSNIVQRLMLVHSEISEAFEAFRNNRYAKVNDFELCQNINQANHTIGKDEFDIVSFINLVKDTLQDEIADSIIRLLAFCGENNIDIEKHIELKMKFNETRGFKYGGKKF